MSRNRRRKQKNIELVRGYKTKPVASSDWDALAANPTLSSAFRDLSIGLQQAQATATQRAIRSSSGADAADYLDISRALAILDQHPELLPFIRELQQGERREMLLDTIKQSPTQSNPMSGGSGWSYNAKTAQGVPNAATWRYYADTDEWLRAGINVRRDQVGRAEIAVSPIDPRRKWDKSIQYSLELILDQPNELRQNWPEQASAVLEDMLVLGRGAWSKSMTADRKPVSLYAEDAATIKIYSNWDGNPDTPRYLYEEPGGSRKVPLRNDEIVMPFLNPASYRFSLSYVQVLINTIKADIEATQQAMRMMSQKPPPHAFQIPNASATQLETLRDTYDRDISGLKEIFWFGGPNPAQHFPLIFSAKENQFLEYQTYLVRKICAILQISPQQLGITFDINKATGETQQEISEDVGLIPLLLLMEDYLNRELVADFAPELPNGRYDLNAVNLCILFPMISEQARQLHARESLAMAQQGLAGLPSMTLNQVLAARGEEPVDGGDTFWIATATGAVPWLSYDGVLGDFAPIATGDTSSQDTSGDVGTDDPGTPNDGGNAEDASATPDSDTAPDESSAEKALWYDARPFGKRWKPSHMQATKEQNL